MAIVDINGGFEDAPSGWTLSGSGCEITTGNARGGVNALRMHTEGDPDLDPAGAALASRTVTVTSGKDYIVSFWISGRDFVAGGGSVQTLVDSETLGTIVPSAGNPYQQQFVGIFTAGSSSITLRFLSVSTFTSSTLWLDDIKFQEATEVAILKTIRTALIDTDLTGISGAVVDEDFRAESQRGDKSIVLTPTEGGIVEDIPEGLRGTTGEIYAQQNYTLKTLRVGSRDEADDWIDAIRDAVEGGTTFSTSAVIGSRVSEFTISGTDGGYHIEANVVVIYHYTRGSA